MTTRIEPRPLVDNKTKIAMQFWIAPLFAAVLSAITLVAGFMVKPHSYEVGFPAFFCFLPMVFFLAATAQVYTQKQVKLLQERIEQLEAKAASAAH